MKQPFLLSIIGILAVTGLFFLGKTTVKQSPVAASKAAPPSSFDISSFNASEKTKLPPALLSKIDSLENRLKKSSAADKELINNSLGQYWLDSAQNPLLYCYYIGEAAELVNSEKNLTFAAQLFLGNLRGERDSKKAEWLETRAMELFNKALALNPENDDLKVGLGSVYIFGKGANGAPEETMKGILKILEVVRKDSNNMKAQLMLGIGGYVSGQYDKAEARLLKVIAKEPDNLEAVAFLADTYAANGKKAEAIRYYEISKRLANNPEYTREVNERIKQLQ